MQQIDNHNPSGGPVLAFQEFIHLESRSQIDLDLLRGYDAIILEQETLHYGIQIIEKLRNFEDNRVYLMPVFLSTKSENNLLNNLVDGILDDQDIVDSINRSAEINEIVHQLPIPLDHWGYEETILFKQFQYLLSRNKDLTAIPTRHSKLGFHFPFLNGFFKQSEKLQMLDLLEHAVNKRWLIPKLKEKINICSSCYGGYLNFRESCNKCNSIDLNVVELVHHFRCAHIAPIHDFDRGDKMVCLKCTKELRHIGIDYDKPSQVYNCNTCDHQSQGAAMKASCIDCGKENSLDKLITRSIYDFQLSALGEEIAKYGLNKAVSASMPDSTSNSNHLDWAIFEIMLKNEMLREKSGNINSYLIFINLKQKDFASFDLGTKQKLSADILNHLSNYLRPMDILGLKNLLQYGLIIPDMEEEKVVEFCELLLNNIAVLLENNLKLGDDFMEINLIKIDSNAKFPWA